MTIQFSGHNNLYNVTYLLGIIQTPQCQENPLIMAAVIEDFEDRFRNLHKHTCCELTSHNTDTSEVLRVLTLLPLKLKKEYGKAIQGMLPTLSCQQRINELFLHLNPLLSFIDYGLLDHIIKVFCSDFLKGDMRSYSIDMQDFMKQTTISQLIDHLPGQSDIPPKFSLLKARIGRDASECTLEEINIVRKRYCSEVNLSEVIFHLVTVTKSNSFIVHWIVPSVLAYDLATSTRAIESSFFQQNAIISLSLNKTWLYDETTSTTLAHFGSLHEQLVKEMNLSRRSVEDLALCLAEKLTCLEDGIYVIELILKMSFLSFADFEILNLIVQKFGSDKLKENMQTYVDGVRIRAKQITVEKMMDLMPICSECAEKCVPIECRVLKEPLHYTLDRVLSLQEKFLSDIQFNKLTLLSVNFRDPRINGSFSVRWLVPTREASHLMSLNQIESDLFQREKIISFSIGSKLLHNPILFEFGAQLKVQCQEFQRNNSRIEWISSIPCEIFQLAMIPGEKVQDGQIKDTFDQMSISSRVDDILHAKTPVKLEDLFRSKGHGSEIILIEGSPSSCGSSLTTHIIHKWAQGELFEEFTLVILVQLGDPSVQRAQSISDLLPCQDVELAQELAAELKATNGRGVLWILDGWDELPPHLQQDSIFCKLMQPISTSQNEKRLLSDSSVIVTCFLTSSCNLYSVISSRVEILGLNLEEQRQYFTDCLKRDKKNLELFLEKIEDNLIVQSSCYLPINAALTVHFFKLKDHSLPSSEYELFSTIIIDCIQHYLKKEGIEHFLPIELTSISDILGSKPMGDLFGKVCELAYRGMMQKDVIFSSSELPQGSNTLGLLQKIESFLEGGKSFFYRFIHHSIQELLAAMHIATSLPDREQVSLFQQFFHQPHYVGIFRFYSCTTKLRTPGMDKVIVETFCKCSKPQRMHLLRCLHEAQNPSLCQFIAKSLRDMLYLVHSLSPLDCLSVGYFISMSNNDKVKRVDISHHHIGDHGVKHLTKYLCDSSSPYSLAQGANFKQFSGWEFCMDSNDIHAEGAAYIAKVLQSSHVINSLNLGSNEIGSQGLQCISQALITNSSLVELDLSYCKLVISEENCSVISEMLLRNKTLEVLILSFYNTDSGPSFADLGQQNTSDIGVLYIAEGLQKNTSLKRLGILLSGITFVGVKYLSNMLLVNNSLTSLDISLNPAIGDEGVSYLAESLNENKTLETLDIGSCNITDTGAASLTDALRTNNSLDKLYLSGNDALTEKGVRLLLDVCYSKPMRLQIPRHLSSLREGYRYKGFKLISK